MSDGAAGAPQPLSPRLVSASRLAPLWIAVAFFAVAATIALVVPLSDDEGRLTYLGARGMGDTFWEFLFFAKMRPAGSLINALPASLGWETFVLTHVALASLGVYWIGRTSEALGGSGWVAALVVAASPAFVAAAVTGQSNSDGVACLGLATYLLFVRRDLLLAGLVLGATPFVRYEFALFALCMAGYGLIRDRSPRFVLGLVAFPTCYLAGGAIFHGDLLWILNFPPTLPTPMAAAGDFDRVRFEAGYLSSLLGMAAVVSPAWVLLTVLNVRALSRDAAVLAAIFGVTVAAMVLLPFTGVFNFEHSSRYWLVLLPFLALLVALQPVASRSRRWSPATSLLAAAGVLVIVSGVAHGPWEPAALLLVPAALIAAPTSRPVFGARAVAAAVVLLGLLALTPAARELNALRSASFSPDLRATVQWLAQRPGPLIYTNDNDLDAAVRQWAPALVGRVRFLPADTICNEIYRLTHPGTGQYEATLQAVSRHGYGEPVWPCEFPVAGQSFEGLLFALRDDRRLWRVYPREFMDAITTEEESFGLISLRRGRNISGPQLEALRPRHTDPALLAPCSRDASGLARPAPPPAQGPTGP